MTRAVAFPNKSGVTPKPRRPAGEHRPGFPLTSGDYGLFAALGKRGSAEDTLTVEFDDFLVTHAG